MVLGERGRVGRVNRRLKELARVPNRGDPQLYFLDHARNLILALAAVDKLSPTNFQLSTSDDYCLPGDALRCWRVMASMKRNPRNELRGLLCLAKRTHTHIHTVQDTAARQSQAVD